MTERVGFLPDILLSMGCFLPLFYLWEISVQYSSDYFQDDWLHRCLFFVLASVIATGSSPHYFLAVYR